MSKRGRLWSGLGAAVAVCVGGLLMLRSLFGIVPAVQPVEVGESGPAPTLPSSQVIRVLSWNVQYCASRRHQFFYDGGDAVHVPQQDVVETVAAVAAAIRLHEPDLALLQEIDRNSSRTARIDQLSGILRACPHPRWSSAHYHRAPYVPHPPGQHLGRVDMNLATLSRWHVQASHRHQLPLLAEPLYRRLFNLRRAVLVSEIPREDGPPLVVVNTHLSAFSRGDGTLGRQVAVLEGLLDDLDRGDRPWILAGDLNMLPPGDDPGRLGDDAELYDETNPIDALFEGRRQSAFAVQDLPNYPGELGTYLPFGAAAPDRTLDYLFVSEGIDVISARVLDELSEVSDHLPLLVELRIP
jgi:endonuclease/exonuclease/phosphatase family metal-dependent hydrolase